MTTPLIEAIARALDAACGYAGDDNVRRAETAITALTEAGYAIVPVEPTEAMLSAGEYDDCHPQGEYFGGARLADSWERMISAAQGDGA